MNSAPRHVLIDALNIAPGGGTVVMARLAHAFSAVGYRVSVVTSRALPDTGFEGSRIEWRMYPEGRGALRSLLFRQFRLARLAREINADALLGFNYYTPVPIPQATYYINVIPFLDFPARRDAVGLLRALVQSRMAKKALRRSTLNMFESEHIRVLAERQGLAIQNPVVAYIGTELSSEPLREPVARVAGPFVTITSGACHKRNDLTVDFFRRIHRIDPVARLDIVGDAEAIRASLSTADRSFLDSCSGVTFHGYIDRDALFVLLAKARALVTFSELESFYMVAVEAMSAGCPVIGADNSSIRESVGAAGLLVDAGDVTAAVTAARKLEQPEVFAQISEAGRAWAARFEAETCARGFEAEFTRKIWPNDIRSDIRETP